MTTSDTATPPAKAGGDEDERHRLTALEGLAALSLDALSSVAYGPEAILVVLMAAGAAALKYTMPITIAIVVLLAVLVISYRQVIEAFPSGGGAYAVAKRHLGVTPSLVAAASLIVDYVLNAAVGSRPARGPTSAFPDLYGARIWLCLAALALITGANLWGVTPRSAGCRCWPACWPRTTSCLTSSTSRPNARCTATAWWCWPRSPPCC